MTHRPATSPEGVIALEDTYARDLEGFYVPWTGDRAPDPTILQFNRSLADRLGLDASALDSPEGAALLTGGWAAGNAQALAQVYAGHQFGGFSAQLGDGRALLLGEIVDPTGARWDLHLKGSGPTPFSRGGDGKAVLGPVLREYLMGEALHALGIPTTRALAAATTGEVIARDGVRQPGAVLSRVAASHIRVGTFEFFAARGEVDKVRRLADYAIARHYPELEPSEAPYLHLLRAVIDRQARLVALWLSVGFVHGVMNTDNVAISGETIDFGPCAFMDAYDPLAVFSSIDRGARYAYGRQPAIAQWNLARFAEAILSLIDSASERAIELVTAELETFPAVYERYWVQSMARKIGIDTVKSGDLELVSDLHRVMEGQEVDFTSLFRALASELRGEVGVTAALFRDPKSVAVWLERWRRRLGGDAERDRSRAHAMDRVNPLYVPRNHKVEEALAAAVDTGLGAFEQLVDVVRDPFEARSGLEAYAQPAPPGFGPYRTFCGT